MRFPQARQPNESDVLFPSNEFPSRQLREWLTANRVGIAGPIIRFQRGFGREARSSDAREDR